MIISHKNLVLIGSSHIAKQSVNEVNIEFSKYIPKIIAIELDAGRLKHLFSKKKDEKIRLKDASRIGFKGYLFAKIGGYVSSKLGESVGMEPGADMKEAAIIAKKHDIRLELIDQEITITLQRFSRFFTWREKWRFFMDALKGVFMPKRQMKELGVEGMDLSKVPDERMVVKMIRYLKKRYPSLYQVLIEERNKVMARRLIMLMKENPDSKVMAVVGAGHVEGIIAIIKRDYNKIELTHTFSHSVTI